jgi:hypothetical protein
MSYQVSDIVNAMPNYFSGRNIPFAQCAENCRKAVLELTESYRFPLIQTSGPIVPLTIYNPGPYNYDTFFQPVDQGMGLEINMLDSFFIYYQGLPVAQQANSGFPLKYKSINDLEILMNIPGLPTNWTRYNDAIYFAMQPIQIYYVYLRYQKEHPFPNAGTASAGNDPILMPNSWQDIVELATAEREASDFDLDDRCTKFHNRLYGDPKFQATGGTEGAPGLIFARTSQQQRDQETTTKAMRLMMRPISR